MVRFDDSQDYIMRNSLSMLYLKSLGEGMKRFFKMPEYGGDDLKNTARLIYNLSVGLILAIILFVVAMLFISPDLIPRAVALAGIVAPASLGAIILIRQKKLRAASILLTGVMWLAVTLGAITAGGVSAPILIGYAVVIIVSGLTVRGRLGIYLALFCIFTGILIAFAEAGGYLPEPQEYAPLARVSIYSFFFAILLLIQHLNAQNMQQLLRQTQAGETRYRSLLETIPTVTYISSLDPHLSKQYISPQVEKLLGHSHRAFLEDPRFWVKILHPEDKNRVLAECQQASTTLEPFEIEYRLMADDQREVWVKDEAIVVRDESGTPLYRLGVWTDITALKEVEEQQAELVRVMTKRAIQLQTAAHVSHAASSILDLNELLPSVVELIRSHFNYYYVGIFLLDKTKEWAILRAGTGEMGRKMVENGYRLKVEDSSMIGWCITHREPRIALDVGQDAVRFKNPYLPLTRSEMALPLLVGGEAIGAMTIQSAMEAAFTRADIITLQTMADQIAIAIQNAQLFTERADLIKILEAQNAELERFTYTVSHDLRSPLVTIRGFLGYLRQDVASKNMTRFEEDLNRIANAVDKMQTLLNSLLELSRIGRVTNPPEDIPFSEILKETIDLLAGSMDAGRARIIVEGNFPIIRGDRLRLSEVMQNLLSNAMKFMGNQPNPTIVIGSAGFDTDGKPIFFVQDNGIGIDPQHHERIFGLFNRLDPTIEGTGIGLTLVRRIIENHGGRIWLQSEPGKGSTFFFTLPVPASE